VLGGQREDALVAAHARAARTLEGAVAVEPGWTDAPPDAEALRAQAERARRLGAEATGDAEARLSAALSAAGAAAEQRAAVNARLEETERRARALASRLADLCADGRTDEARDAEVARLALRWDAALARVAQVDAALAAAGEDPRAEVVKLTRRLSAADEAATTALEREKLEEGRLAQLGAQGTYTAVAAAEEDVARLRAEVSREELRARAVRLLRATVAACRSEAVAAIAEPVAEAATRALHRIGGGALGPLRLGEGFEPQAVVPASAGAPVSLSETSGGEQEQVHLATRLALADVLARGERQLVVLDDALLATDARRTERILALLAEASARVQVLVITCHPERYRALAGATQLDLEALINAPAL
jgi:uncharacterized protein YhaN